MMLFKSLVAGTLAALAAMVSGQDGPVRWNPRIISPNETTVWRIGDLVNVTWCVYSTLLTCTTRIVDQSRLFRDLSDMPAKISDGTRLVQLNNEKGPMRDSGSFFSSFFASLVD